jgi:hypothetical protein
MNKSKASKKKPVQANKKEAVQTNRKKTAHRKVACSPAVKSLIHKLRTDWEHLDDIQCSNALRDLVLRGCSIRGLASDFGVPETTLRRYKKFSSPPEPQAVAVEAQVSNKKALGGDAVRGRVRESVELRNRMAPPTVEKPPRDLSDEVADIILDFCKNAVPDEPIRDHVLPDLLREVKKCLGGEIWITLASIHLPERISLPDLYRITRPPRSPEDYWLAHRATWLATIVKAKAPKSIRETAFAKATQRAAELMPQPIPGEKKPTRIHPLQIIEHGFSLRNRR